MAAITDDHVNTRLQSTQKNRWKLSQTEPNNNASNLEHKNLILVQNSHYSN